MSSQRNSRFYEKVKNPTSLDTLAISDLEAQRNLISKKFSFTRAMQKDSRKSADVEALKLSMEKFFYSIFEVLT